jgi:hypothetical protein
MIDLRAYEIVIVESLKKYLTTDTRPCEVVRQNQVAEVPPYPYVSYTQTTMLPAMSGTYSEADDGTKYRSIYPTWSFTVQSDDQDEASILAMKMFDFFSAVGVNLLAEHDIIVSKVRDVTPRDNMLSIQYEYRNGLDVTFGFLYVIAPDVEYSAGVIESIEI